jgi:predicted neutral ceramidase superfamily lipid hydrolase
MAGVALVDPITNPIGFMIFFFLANDLYDPSGVIKIAFFMSVLIYPVLLLGWFLNPKITKGLENTVKKPLIIYFITTLVSVIVFWVYMRVWYILLNPNSQGFSFALVDFIKMLVILSVFAYPFVLLGNFLLKKIKQQWKMPDVITVYLIDLAMCLVVWFIIWGFYVLQPVS